MKEDSVCRRFVYLLLMGATATALMVAGPVACEEGEDDDASTSSLTVSPATATCGAGTTNVAFTALGGVPPYHWVTSDSSLGPLLAASNTVVYTSSGVAGTNYLTVVDGATNSATAIILQN